MRLGRRARAIAAGAEELVQHFVLVRREDQAPDRQAELARDVLDTPLVKLEVLGDPKTLLPDPVGTLEATRELVSQGFDVMVYCSDDPRLGVHLAELGAVAVMPAGNDFEISASRASSRCVTA